MRIIICDDDLNSAKCLKEMLNTYTDVDEVIVTNDTADVICWLEERKKIFDVVMMDIVLDEKNGIEEAAAIIEKYPEVRIVFITGYMEKYAQDIFLEHQKLKPFALISKPYDVQVVERVINLIHCDIAEECRINFNAGHKKYSLTPEQIMYIESNGHISNLHIKNGTVISCYKKLAEFKNMLPESFEFCHKSFLVNFDFIYGIEETNIIIYEDILLPISRRYAANFRKKLFSYRCFGGK